jgi:penicillin-binding protein 1A
LTTITPRFVHLEGSDPRDPVQPKHPINPLIVAVFACIVLLCGIAAGSGLWFFNHMYKTLLSPDEIQSVAPALVSKVYARDGSLIHEFSVERRFWVPLSQIPVDLCKAVVATEDRRFYKHWGVDLHRIAGAFFVNIVRGESAQGGSTITQQLARNLYLSLRKSMIRKIREAMTAVQMEKYYTKDQILELYLNQVYLGAGVYGVEAASQRYFSKPVAQCNLNECTVIAGLIQLPEKYRPDKPENHTRLAQRRKAVLAGMRAMRFVTKTQACAVLADSVPSNPQKITARIAPYFIEMVRDHIEKKYGEEMLYNGGLEIFTTLDAVAQTAAEDTLKKHLAWLQHKTNRIFLDYSRAHVKEGVSKDFYIEHFDSLYNLRREQWEALPDTQKLRIVQASVIALDETDNGITVLIGGRDFSESKFNRALQALRQPGSAFKPILYAAAIDSSYTTVSVVLDQPVTIETPEGLWRPENYDGEFLGPVTIRQAMKKSINLVPVQIIRDIGENTVITLARRMGLTHQLNAVPSLAIGSCEVTPMEMVVAYSIFAHQGKLVRPYAIERVLDKNGRILEEIHPREEDVLSPQTAYIMTSLMRSVVTSGTAAAIPGMGFTRPAAGKTGTTNDFSDAWFIGYTQQAVCGVWVGVDAHRTIGYGVTGAVAAIPVWVKTMKALHRNLPVEEFRQPDGIVLQHICSKSNKLASASCPVTYDDYFIEGKLPSRCDLHGSESRGKSKTMMRLFGTEKTGKNDDKTKRKKQLMF